MTQFSGLDVKIELGNNMMKRVKTPLSFAALSSQVSSLAKAKSLQEPVTIRYIDHDGESIVIEDDSDLEMAYTCALSNDKRIKFIVDQASSAPIQTVQPIQKEVEEVQMIQQEPEPISIAKKKRDKKDADKGIPRKALKNLIQRELESAAKETFI